MKTSEAVPLIFVAVLFGLILLYFDARPSEEAAANPQRVTATEQGVASPVTVIDVDAKPVPEIAPVVGLTAEVNRPDGTWTPYGVVLMLVNTGMSDDWATEVADVAATCIAWSGGDPNWEGTDKHGTARYGLCGTLEPGNPKTSAKAIRRTAEDNRSNGLKVLAGNERWIDSSYRTHLPDVHEALNFMLDDSIRFVARIPVSVDIVESFSLMIAHAIRDGIELTGWGWRSPEKTRELRFANCSKIRDNPDLLMTLPPSQCETPTAIPGTSRHETGKAIDFNKYDPEEDRIRGLRSYDVEFKWLEEHAADYGLFNYKPEPWHWSVDAK